MAVELEQIAAGDEAAFRALIREEWTSLVRYAHGMTGSWDAAQDVAQEALVRLWERRETWSDGTARGLLFRIARNAALDRDRRREVRVRHEPALAAHLDRSPPNPEQDAAEAELGARVRDAVASLPERRAEVFRLVRFHGMAYDEAAAVLGLSKQTVANQMSLALKDLRHLLADLIGSIVGGEDDRTGSDGRTDHG